MTVASYDDHDSYHDSIVSSSSEEATTEGIVNTGALADCLYVSGDDIACRTSEATSDDSRHKFFQYLEVPQRQQLLQHLRSYSHGIYKLCLRNARHRLLRQEDRLESANTVSSIHDGYVALPDLPYCRVGRLTTPLIPGLLTIIRKNRLKEREMRILFL
jgi:hypothetical protein